MPYPVVQVAVAPRERALLHERIERRFKQMLDEGFVDEVKKLRQRGDLHLDLPALRCVGYRQVWQYLDGEYDEATMIDRGIFATRQLAKRQLTWLRKWPGVRWFDSLDESLFESVLSYCEQVPENFTRFKP